MTETQEMSNVKAIRTYFGDDFNRVSMTELKELSAADRQELGELAKKELETTN